ncbi:UNVERIFIED_CONTAM: hypothetical protein Sindi_1831000 [Sesamum indicum]
MRYLGLPLISSRLSISDCQPLISKIDARINGWEGISLSYAGRVQIIKFVLSALSLYWASAFILPKKVINEIEKRLRTFLWKGTTSSGYAKVAWKDVCRPTDEGGLGFKDISTLNCALMSKKLCDVIRCDRTSIWVPWLYQDRLHDTSIWTVREHRGSWGWRKMLKLYPFLRSIVNYQIGDGGRFYVWQDPWHHLGPLIEQFPWGPNNLGIEKSAKLSSVISAGEWQWPPITDFECLEITYNLPFIFGACVYHIWRERNLRRFEHSERTPTTLSILITDDVKQRILSANLTSSVSTRALYRLWRLSTVASGVGKPLYPDAITRACTRLDFARVCVMIDVTHKMTKHIIVMAPDEDGGETPYKVDVEYEWLPPKCTTCMSLGHAAKECALNKPHKPTEPPVNVYVPKVNVPPPKSPAKEQRKTKPVAVDLPRANAGDMHVERNSSKQNERGKAIVISNAFDALHLIDDADEHSWGPNTSNPMCNDPC